MKLVFNVFTQNLDYVASTPGDVGIVFPLAPNLGGTGIANAAGSTLTLGAATSITGGGTIGLGGFTLTVPATMTAAGRDVNNVFTGSNTFPRGTNPANLNTFIGGAGNATATSTGCVGIGSESLDSLTSGIDNFGLGTRSFTALTTTSDNVGIGINTGRYATGNQNIAIGSNAYMGVSGQTNGDGNVIIGYNAGDAITTADNVVLIGEGAGGNLTTGSLSIFIGKFSGFRQTTTANLFIVDTIQRASAAVEVQNCYLYGSMAAGGYLQLNIPTTTNNAIQNTLKLQAYVSTASAGSANGFGVGLPFLAETATDGTYQQQGLVSTYWVDATNATRKATLALSAYDTAERKGIEIRANGTTPDIALLGDTWWEGEGFGLPYGSCSSNDTDINWTQASAVQNTWYDISDADMVDGQLNLVTHDGSGKLTVTLGGRYLINYSLVAESSAANNHLETAISVSGTESGQGISHAEAVTPNAERNFSGTAILDLAANATINLSIRTTDAGTPTLKVEMMDITLVMVGGT